MGKMTMALLVVFAIELAMTLFLTGGNGHTSLYTLLIDPSGLAGDSFFLMFVGRIAAIGTLSAIVAGFLFLIRVEPAYAIITATFITFGLNIVGLWTAINSQATFGDSNALIATIICAPLLIFYIMASMDYIRSPNG